MPGPSASTRTSRPSPTAAGTRAVEEALRLADLWLDAVTDLPSGTERARAWSRQVSQTRSPTL